MKNKLERRFLRQEFRVSDEKQPARISGYAAVFDSRSEDLGWFTEEVDPHAFDMVMAANPDVRALFNHDANHVLGRTAANTLRLSVDARGLAYEIDPPDTQTARDLLTSMRRGDITQSSFGFIVARDQWTDEEDGSVSRRILEIGELFDVSPVTFPAYNSSAAQVSSRDLPSTMPREMRARLLQRAGQQDDDGDCECDCPECQNGDCENCSNADCGDPNCRCSRTHIHRRKTQTKKVDGENLTADCFLIVGDPEKTDTWHLPWKFSDEEKTKSHLRDALARFDQVEGPSEAEKKTAYDKLVKLCKEHDIEVSAEGDARAWKQRAEMRLRIAQASLPGPQIVQRPLNPDL
jgi:hypothetical protein